MSHKIALRTQREGTIINTTSSKQEKLLRQAVKSVSMRLKKKFPGITLEWEPQAKLIDIIVHLRTQFPDVDFAAPSYASSMKPDGGILYMKSEDERRFPILISEKKNQGTNDMRAKEGKKRQAQGNAIERLGKNVIGFRASMIRESIFPFVCFGDGCDFVEGSSIRDRVITIAMFGQLNKEYVYAQGRGELFNRGSFYFREKQWTEQEMADISFSIASKAIFYYFSRYGESTFFDN